MSNVYEPVVDCRDENGAKPELVPDNDAIRAAVLDGDLSDAEAMTIASWYMSPGRIGQSLAQLATTGYVPLSALFLDIETTRHDHAWSDDQLRELDALAAWADNHPTVEGHRLLPYRPRHWHVGASQPGCLPDSEPTCVSTMEDVADAYVSLLLYHVETADDGEYLRHVTWAHNMSTVRDAIRNALTMDAFHGHYSRAVEYSGIDRLPMEVWVETAEGPHYHCDLYRDRLADS